MSLELPEINLSDVVTKPQQPKGERRYLLKYISPGVFALQIDNSSLEVFTTCARAAEYKLLYARESGSSAALTYGGAIHNGLEEWYRGGMDSTSDDLWSRMIERASERYKGDQPSLGEWRTFDRCVDTLSKYISKYPTEVFTIHHVNSTPQVEIPFSLPLGVIELDGHETHYTFGELVDPTTYTCDPSTPIHLSEVHVYWTGKMDVLIHLDGQLWVMDHKTTSVGGPTYFKEFELSQQTIGYCWAGQEIYGERIHGLLANVIIGRKPTRTGIPTDFERQRYYYRPDQIAEWKDDVLSLVSDFAANIARSFFPRMTKWCVGKYGACRYHDVCTLPPQQRLSMLYSDAFVNCTWSPLTD